MTATASQGPWRNGPTYVIELDPHDLVSNYLKNGEVYATGGHLYYAMENSQLISPFIEGNLKTFHLTSPGMIPPGQSVPIKDESPVIQNVQTVGEGELTIERSILLR